MAIKAIQHDIPITNEQFSLLQSAFLVTYAVMYAGGGKLMDVLGTRAGFLAIMVFWSLACASHGLATSFGMLAVSRLLLGMGEGGGFPAATRAVAEWFPVHGTLDGDGHHQRRHGGRRGGRAAADRARPHATPNWRWRLLPHRRWSASLWTVWWLRWPTTRPIAIRGCPTTNDGYWRR